MSITAGRAGELMDQPRLRRDGPRLWHHIPGPQRSGPLDSRIALTGAAVARAGIDSVWVRLDAGQAVRARHGRPNLEVRRMFADEHGPGSGDWEVAFDAWAWSAGRHRVEALAVNAAGGATLAVRDYHLDLEGAYTRWRTSRLAPRAQGADPSARIALLLLASGPVAALAIGALRQACSCRWWVALVGDPDRRFARSPEWAALPAEHRLDSGELAGFEDALRAAEARGCSHVAFAQAGDLLHPGALDAMSGCGDAELVYCDEDRLLADGRRVEPRFKPQWSPRLLLAQDYIGPCFMVRTPALRRARELAGRPFTCTYDVLLALMDAGASASQVPVVLYSRACPPPGGLGDAETQAIHDHARRHGQAVTVEPADPPGARRLRWTLSRPLVSIVMPTAGNASLLRPCLRSIAERTSYERVELVLLDTSAGTGSFGALLPDRYPSRVLSCAQPFNFSLLCNIGALAARGEALLFLNDDVEVLSGEWIERMLEQLQRPGVGIVGAKLLYPGGLVQHAGVFFAKRGPSHVGLLLPGDEPGPGGALALPRDCVAVTGACLMISRQGFELLGGFDERIAIEYGDVDLCLRAGASGLGVVYAPEAVLIHHESVTRGEAPVPADRAEFRRRWPSAMRGDERYFPRYPMRP